MASYVLEGYTTPDGVNSRQKVKEYQTQLGVKADGIWGPKTQAAYEAMLGKSANANPWDALDGFYDRALSMYSAPTVHVSTPSRDEIQSDMEAALRPGVDQAIEGRRARGQANMAELDADAASRGMGASTYVTSMKGRELSNTEQDVARLESNYAATLSERVAEYMKYYANLELQAQMQNAQMSYNAQAAAASLASQWYSAYLSANAASGAGTASSSRSSASKSTTAAKTEYFTMTADDYENLVRGMSAAERAKLYNSNDSVWKESRDELYTALGADRYASLAATADPKKSAKSAGSKATWQQQQMY